MSNLDTPVLTEIMSITEQIGNTAVIIFNDNLLGPHAQRSSVMEALSVLGRKTLLEDRDKVVTGTTIEHSPDPKHENIIMELKFMMNENNDLTTLVYFGKIVDESTPLEYALTHAAEVLDLAVKNY